MDDRFLPVTREEMLERGWDTCDFVYVCGDAYVDHPSFGAALFAVYWNLMAIRYVFYLSQTGEIRQISCVLENLV